MSIVKKTNDLFKKLMAEGKPVQELSNLAVEMAKFDMTMGGNLFHLFKTLHRR